MIANPTYTLSWEQRVSPTLGTTMSIQGDYDSIKCIWINMFKYVNTHEWRRNIHTTVQKTPRHKVREFDPTHPWPRMDRMGMNKLLFPPPK